MATLSIASRANAVHSWWYVPDGNPQRELVISQKRTSRVFGVTSAVVALRSKVARDGFCSTEGRFWHIARTRNNHAVDVVQMSGLKVAARQYVFGVARAVLSDLP
jgi:hypothetical protein